MKSIADVVSASGLAGYAEVALVIFFAVFLLVGLRAMFANREALERSAHLPFDDGTTHDGASRPGEVP
jgi:hypothetical protein